MSRPMSPAGPEPTSIAEWFRRRAQREPTNPALTFDERTYSYGELQREVERLAAVLAEGGLGRGDRVAFLGFNHVAIPIALLATSRLGAIFVPINFRLSAEEVRAVIVDAGAHTVIADETHGSVVGHGAAESFPARAISRTGRVMAGSRLPRGSRRWRHRRRSSKVGRRTWRS